MDINYLLFLQELREKLSPAVEIFMGIISAIDVHFMVILIPALFYWCLNKKNGEFIFFTYCFGDFLNGVLKLSVCCYRPWIRDPRIIPSKYAIAHATGYSFPSGHSVNAGTIFVSTVNVSPILFVPLMLALPVILAGFTSTYMIFCALL